MASKGTPPKPGSPYPFNFSGLTEGSHDPVLEKDVKWLIDSDDDYIVYIDEQNYVEWTMNQNDRLPDEAGPVLTRVGWLESADDQGLNSTQVEAYKRLIGEGVARLFDGNVAAANAAMDTAQSWISARAAEACRVWLLEGASAAYVLVAIVFSIFWYINGLEALVHQRLTVITGSVFGALGAWLSILQRSGTENLDLGAGPRVRRVEGLSRVLTGAVGGLFVSLLMSAGYLLSAEITNRRAFFFAVCMVAGLSERLVNSLAGQVESSATVKVSQTRGASSLDTTDAGKGGPSSSGRSASGVLDLTAPQWGSPIPPPPR